VQKALKTFLIVFPIFFIIIFLVTLGLLNGYFEQDEWLGIATVMKSYNLPWWSIFIPGQMHFTPVGNIIWGTLYKLFKFQAQYFYLVELIVHASVSTLVLILTARLTKNKTIAILTGILFLLNGRAYQGFTHLAIFHTTDTAMFFMLLFFIYITGIKEKILTIKKTIILFLIFFAAACTREEGFIIIPILIVYLLTFGKKMINIKNIIPLSLFSVGFIIFLFLRFSAQSLYTEPIPLKYQITGYGAKYNLLTLPPKYVVQNLIFYDRISTFYLNNVHKAYPDIESYFTSQAPLMDAAFFYIFSLILIVFILWLWIIKPKGIVPLLLFCLAWIWSNAFMLSFAGRNINVIEPRYLYFSGFPVLCLVSMFCYHLFNFKHKLKIVGLVSKILAVLLISVLLLTSLQEIRKPVDYANHSGTVKKTVLGNLRHTHPILSKNTIFYIKCKIKCYRNLELGIPNENVLPFGSGPGLNILLTYASIQGEEKEWGPFFINNFLFFTYAEDYKKIGDRSFGYFITKTKLEETLKKNKISKDIVVALEYNEANYTFKDISKNFRQTLNVESGKNE